MTVSKRSPGQCAPCPPSTMEPHYGPYSYANVGITWHTHAHKQIEWLSIVGWRNGASTFRKLSSRRRIMYFIRYVAESFGWWISSFVHIRSYFLFCSKWKIARDYGKHRGQIGMGFRNNVQDVQHFWIGSRKVLEIEDSSISKVCCFFVNLTITLSKFLLLL